MNSFIFKKFGWAAAVAVIIMAGAAGAQAQTWNVGQGASTITGTLSDDSTLTISGGGIMTNFCCGTSPPWPKDKIKAVVTTNGQDIASGAFSGCAYLTSVTLSGHSSVGSEAFSGCVSLKTITLPGDVGYGAFANCTNLETVVVPADSWVRGSSLGGLNTSNGPAFAGCTKLMSFDVSSDAAYVSSVDGVLFNKDKTELLVYPKAKVGEYTIPDGVVSIGRAAFEGCGKLTSITIPNTVTSIPALAFSGCGALSSIVIPNSVTSIGVGAYYQSDGAFYGCKGLTSIVIPSSVTSIGYSAFASCTGLTSIVIPNSVQELGGSTFESCSGLKSLVIPNSVTKTDGNNWKGCGNLRSVSIGNDRIFAGSGNSFSGFSQLDSVTLGPGVTSIRAELFKDCKSLTYVVLGNGVKYIGNSAFNGCSKIPTVFFGDSLKYIGNNAFQSCSTLTSITIPNGMDSIGSSAFVGCTGLTFAAIGGGVIGSGAFAGNTNLTTLVFGNNVKSVNGFNGCTRLTTLTIPDNVKSIGGSAFSGCSRLQTATIGNGVDTIGQSAFQNCAGLTSVIIGNKVKFINSSAFDGCTGLTSLTSLASDPPVVANANTFSGIDKTACVLKVQQIDMGMYRAAQHWKDFTNIEAVTFPNVPVMDITGVPTSFKVGEALTLVGTVTPSTATNKAIDWSVAGASIAGTNFTGAVIADGNKLSAASPGTVVVRAAIESGAITGVDFERYFFIAAEGEEEEEETSVLSGDRVVPSVKPPEVSAVAPVSKLTAEFTVGPNPVGALGATPVRFFRSGGRILSASLRVYDATGNVVRKISVNDNAAVGGNGRRAVGSWDLTDGRGRRVPEGTYLVRGTVTSKDGKRERVSAVVGVR